MTEIPADVMAAARKAFTMTVKVFAPHFGINGDVVGHIQMVDLTDAHMAAARAIMAERERCARIADECGGSAIQFMNERLDGHSNDFQRFRDGCVSVAAAIRAPSK